MISSTFMAIIRLGTTVTAIRGTIGGLTYSANRLTPYVTAWHYPSDPKSTKQQSTRSTLTSLATSWQALPPTTRTAWNDYATINPEPTYNSLGILLNLTGYNYFIRCNTRIRLLLLNPISSPGSTTRPDAPTITSLVAYAPTSGPLTIHYTSPHPPSSHTLILSLAIAPYTTGTPRASAFRYAAPLNPNSSPYTSHTIIRDLFGLLPPGFRLTARLTTCNHTSGIYSPPTQLSTSLIA